MKYLVCIALAACGRIDFDPLATDAPAGSDAATCLGTGAFTDIQAVTAINDAEDQYGPFLSADGLTLVWDQSDGTDEHPYMSRRAARTDAFTAGSLIPGAFPAGGQYNVSITADALELYFDSAITGTSCLYRATRSSTAVPFDAPVELTTLCTGTTVGPGISADGLTLVYNSGLDNANEGDLYITVRGSRSDEFPVGKKLNGLPTGVGYPWLSQDRLRIWFEHETGTGLEIATAQRISPSDDFSSVHAVTELNTGMDNGDPGLTLDESEIVFASTRAGSYDVYIALRPCL